MLRRRRRSCNILIHVGASLLISAAYSRCGNGGSSPPGSRGSGLPNEGAQLPPQLVRRRRKDVEDEQSFGRDRADDGLVPHRKRRRGLLGLDRAHRHVKPQLRQHRHAVGRVARAAARRPPRRRARRQQHARAREGGEQIEEELHRRRVQQRVGRREEAQVGGARRLQVDGRRRVRVAEERLQQRHRPAGRRFGVRRGLDAARRVELPRVVHGAHAEALQRKVHRHRAGRARARAEQQRVVRRLGALDAGQLERRVCPCRQFLCRVARFRFVGVVAAAATATAGPTSDLAISAQPRGASRLSTSRCCAPSSSSTRARRGTRRATPVLRRRCWTGRRGPRAAALLLRELLGDGVARHLRCRRARGVRHGEEALEARRRGAVELVERHDLVDHPGRQRLLGREERAELEHPLRPARPQSRSSVPTTARRCRAASR